MGYQRLYASANNTLFHYIKIVNTSTGTQSLTSSDTINCGASRELCIFDGHGESRIVLAFTLSDIIKEKLSNFSYQVNLQLFDAGTLFLPPINLKQVVLESFTQSFVEGDGFSFFPPQNMIGVSNWIQSDSVNLWADATFTPITTYNMQRINEDFTFDVTATITSAFQNNINPQFSLKIGNRTNDPVNVFTKYIYSRHTNTVFQPYLEFIFNDTIIDQTFNCIAGQTNNIFLINQLGTNFSVTPTCQITYDNNTSVSPTVTTFGPGSYYITITPPMPTTIKTTYATAIWSIGGLQVQKQIIQICSPNKLIDDINHQYLFFYPTTPYSHNIVRQGDIIPFTIVSQIRGKGDVVADTYQYRVTSADGFEMVPWTKANVYRKKIYFYVDTSYFFPENQYEVWIRNATVNYSITSNLTHKFKVAINDKSHLRDLSVSPYYSRDQFLQK